MAAPFADGDAQVIQKAVAAAHAYGALFTECGADVKISVPDSVELPGGLRATLGNAALRQHFRITAKDREAVAFLDIFNVEAVVLKTAADADAAKAELDRQLISLDIETAPIDPTTKPPPFAVNKDGSPAHHQPDIGKDGLDPFKSRIATVQMCAEDHRAFFFIGAALRRLLEDRAWWRRQDFVIFNATFELLFLRHAGIPLRRTPHCMMQAGSVGYGYPRKLEHVARHVLKVTPPKQHGTTFWGARRLSRGQLAYGLMDAVLTHKVKTEVLPRFARSRRARAYQLQRQAALGVTEMMFNGLGHCLPIHKEIIGRWQTEEAAAVKEFRELTGQDPPRTPREKQAFIVQVIGERAALSWPTTEKRGELSTRSGHIRRLAYVEGDPTRDGNMNRAVTAMLQIGARKHWLANFGEKLIGKVNPQTGRFHATYNIGAAVSGRFSCSNPNLQNFPSRKYKEFRRIIRSRDGYLLVLGDWSMVELRAVQWISKCPDLLRAFIDKLDKPYAFASGEINIW